MLSHLKLGLHKGGSKLHIRFIFIIFLKIIHLTERESTSRGAAEGEGESDSPLGREPKVGFDPRTQDHDLSQSQTLN